MVQAVQGGPDHPRVPGAAEGIGQRRKGGPIEAFGEFPEEEFVGFVAADLGEGTHGADLDAFVGIVQGLDEATRKWLRPST